MPRWVAVPAVLAVVAGVCAFTLHRALTPAQLITALASSSVPADGFSSTELTIRSSNGRELRGLEVRVENPHQLALESLTNRDGAATATLQAGVMPGQTKLRISAPGFASREVAVKTTPDDTDAVGDGTPDFLRLHDPADQVSFRRWFTLLAEAQYFRGQNAAPEIDDCGALLRFAYREALRQHDAAWGRAIALPAPATAGNIQQYQYPYTPLGAALFRVREGSFTGADLHDGAFAEFADAETLWRYNTFSIGRSLPRARPGDLLFFRQGDGHMPFHAMIFLGRSQIDPGTEEFVVYDTGPTGSSKGIIKRLSTAELLNYPDPRWRPVPSNPAFLGIYRWNILRGGE